MNKKILLASGLFGLGVIGLQFANSYGVSENEKKVFHCKLVEKKKLNDNTLLLKFQGRLGFDLIPVSHIYALDGGNIYRPYTPVNVSRQTDTTFDLILKTVKGGYFSNVLANLKLNEKQHFFGPEQTLELIVEEKTLSIKHMKKNQNYSGVEKLFLICTGTALAPMIQIIEHLNNTNSETQITLIHFARTNKSNLYLPEHIKILLYSNNINCTVVVNETPCSEKHFQKGDISESTLSGIISPPSDDTAVVVSGSDTFLSKICGIGHQDGQWSRQPPLGGILHDMGFQNDQVFRL